MIVPRYIMQKHPHILSTNLHEANFFRNMVLTLPLGAHTYIRPDPLSKLRKELALSGYRNRKFFRSSDTLHVQSSDTLMTCGFFSLHSWRSLEYFQHTNQQLPFAKLLASGFPPASRVYVPVLPRSCPAPWLSPPPVSSLPYSKSLWCSSGFQVSCSF